RRPGPRPRHRTQRLVAVAETDPAGLSVGPPRRGTAFVAAGGSRRSGSERRTASAVENGLITIRPAQWSAVAMVKAFLLGAVRKYCLRNCYLSSKFPVRTQLHALFADRAPSHQPPESQPSH